MFVATSNCVDDDAWKQNEERCQCQRREQNSNTHSNRDAAYETEQVNDKLEKIIELLEKIVKSKKTGY